MALRLTTLKRAVVEFRPMLESRRFSHVPAISPALNGPINLPTASRPMVLSEFYQDQPDSIGDKNFRFGFPSFSFGGSMELMAVPKKKILASVARIEGHYFKTVVSLSAFGHFAAHPWDCKSCGRVELPHFYCCSGERASPDEQRN